MMIRFQMNCLRYLEESVSTGSIDDWKGACVIMAAHRNNWCFQFLMSQVVSVELAPRVV